MTTIHEENNHVQGQTEATTPSEGTTTIDTTNLITSSLPDELKLSGKAAITELLILVEELRMKQEEVKQQRDMLKETLTAMAAKGGITFDAQQFKQNETQINEYTTSLASIIDQLSSELYILTFFVAPEMLDQKSEVFKHISTASGEHVADPVTIVTGKIPAIKKSVKTIRRDVAVSHSRYSHSFNVQMQQLISIQRALAQK